MKHSRIVVLLVFLLAAAITFMQFTEVHAQTPSGLVILRQTGKGTIVSRFEDGPNTCYLVENDKYTTKGVSVSVAISCIPRTK